MIIIEIKKKKTLEMVKVLHVLEEMMGKINEKLRVSLPT